MRERRPVGVVNRWASFKPPIRALSWRERHRAGRSQQSLHGMFCPDKSLYKPHSGYIHFQMWKSLQKPQASKQKPKQNQDRRHNVLCTRFEVLCLKHSQGELFDLDKVFSSIWVGIDWARCGASIMRDSSREVRQASVKSWLLSLFPY